MREEGRGGEGERRRRERYKNNVGAWIQVSGFSVLQ